MKWKMERKVEKAIEILEIANRRFGNFTTYSLTINTTKKLINCFSFVQKYNKVIELWNDHENLRICLVYSGKRYYSIKFFFKSYIEDIEL
jgi:hypothetical protein